MESLYGIVRAILKGLFDSLKGAVSILYIDKHIRERAEKISPIRENRPPKRRESVKEPPPKQEEPTVLSRTIQCCLLNGGVVLLSILFFDYGLLPALKSILILIFGDSPATGKLVWSWIKPLLSWTFSTIWVLPLFILSKIINSLWFQDIANSAFRYSRGRPQTMSSVSKMIADTFFSILVQALFLVQGMLVSLLPLVMLGEVLCLVHMCMLYSLYAFEYKWFNMGWELHKRLTFIENNWPYFLGFGLPLALSTSLPSSYIMSGCIFSILFPLFIISGNDADPVTGACDYPLQLFSPVIVISNALFNRTIGQKAPPTPVAVSSDSARTRR